MDYKELLNLGLSEKEAKVYLSSLELGKDVVQNIAKKANVNRATTYVIIDSLTKKGLMSSFFEGKKQYFYAESPEKLNLLFREEAMSIQRKQEYLDKLLPNLKALNIKNQEKPVVRYFEGKRGLRTMNEEFFSVKHDEEVRHIFSLDLLNTIFTKEERAYMKIQRTNKGVKSKAIVNDDDGLIYNTDEKRMIIPSKKYEITSDIALFGDKIRIATQKGDLLGMIIENKEICNTLKILFDLAIENLEKKEKD